MANNGNNIRLLRPESVVDTGGKFAADVVDTGGNLPPVSTTLAKLVANLPPVSLIPATILPPVSLTPVTNFPPVSLIPVVHLYLRISPRIFEKIRNSPNGILWAGGKLIHEKYQKQKVS